MSRTRVLDLAKELGIETKVAIFKLQELGIQVKNHFNAVSEVEAAKLRALHRSGKTADGGAHAKPANKLIIRRKVETASEDIAQDEKETVQTQQNTSETDKKAAAFESASSIEPKKETFQKEMNKK